MTDTTAPTIVDLPDDITVEAGTGRVRAAATGTTVTWAAPTATDTVDPAPTVVCDPASGSSFDLGTTRVTCTASDDAGNTTTGSFDVTVLDATVEARPTGTPTTPAPVTDGEDTLPIVGAPTSAWATWALLLLALGTAVLRRTAPRSRPTT